MKNVHYVVKKLMEMIYFLNIWKFLESDAENNYNIAKEAIRISKEGLKDLNLIF